VRQLGVQGLGRERFTLFLSNNFEETARDLIIRYAGRNQGTAQIAAKICSKAAGQRT
jgi:hypothetical protein